MMTVVLEAQEESTRGDEDSDIRLTPVCAWKQLAWIPQTRQTDSIIKDHSQPFNAQLLVSSVLGYNIPS